MDIRVVKCIDLSPFDRECIAQLFDQNYTQADLSYLDKSVQTFRQVAIAEHNNQMAGFSFGDSIRRPLPRMQGDQCIALAGIACIDPGARRQGLFMQLSIEAMQAGGGIEPNTPMLFAGRMAHVATYGAMAKLSPATVVPAPGKPISTWHQEVAHAVAAILDSKVNPRTMVVKGSGTAVGYPRLEYVETPEERELFSQVNRDRGDSLLTMCWLPDAPLGW